VPVHDDAAWFEFLTLEGFQAGLSWFTILKRRENFRKAFAGFDARKVAKFGARDVARLMKDAGIIRNRQKIDATIGNARAFLAVQKEFGSFDAYMWKWVGGKPLVNRRKTLRDLPAKTDLAERISADMKSRNFRFVGPTIVYAHMQATGMVNDHLVGCPRWKEVQECRKKSKSD